MYILRDPREIWPAGRYVVGYEKTMIAGAMCISCNVQCFICYSSYTMSIQGVRNFSDNKIRSTSAASNKLKYCGRSIIMNKSKIRGVMILPW